MTEQNIRAILPPLFLASAGLSLAVVWPWFFLLTVIGFLDAFGRNRDYHYLVKFKFLPARLLDYYGRSYCGRNVIVSIRPIYAEYYRAKGYKWWHFLPNNFPQPLFKPQFWRNMVFGHRY